MRTTLDFLSSSDDDQPEYINDFNERDPDKIDCSSENITDIQVLIVLENFTRSQSIKINSSQLTRVANAAKRGFKFLKKGAVAGKLWLAFIALLKSLKERWKPAVNFEPKLAQSFLEIFNDVSFRSRESPSYARLMEEFQETHDKILSVCHSQKEEFNAKLKRSRNARKRERKRMNQNRRRLAFNETLQLPQRRPREEEVEEILPFSTITMSIQSFFEERTVENESQIRINPEPAGFIESQENRPTVNFQEDISVQAENSNSLPPNQEATDAFTQPPHQSLSIVNFNSSTEIPSVHNSEPPLPIQPLETPQPPVASSKAKFRRQLQKTRPEDLQFKSKQYEAYYQLKQNRTLQEVIDSHSDCFEKIVLFLDIDNTLLECIEDKNVKWRQELVGRSVKIMIKHDREGSHRYIFLRPYVREFLKRVSKFCELWIYTAGTTEYANEVVKVLDPNRNYFGNRIVSRTNETEQTKTFARAKLIKDFDETMALAIDDQISPWVNENHCVIRSLKFTICEEDEGPQTFFYSPRVLFNDTLRQTNETFQAPKPQLVLLADVLETLYSSFIENSAQFAMHYLLYLMRQSVLSGFNLDFSRYLIAASREAEDHEDPDRVKNTEMKIVLLKSMAKALGGSEGRRIYVVENPVEDDELSSQWLLNCFFFISNS